MATPCGAPGSYPGRTVPAGRRRPLCASATVAKSCATQLAEIAAAEKCAVSAVQATHESKLPYYGAVGGRLVSGRRKACMRSPGAGETHTHRGRAENDRARTAGRSLPLFLRHARAHARRSWICSGRTWPSRQGRSDHLSCVAGSPGSARAVPGRGAAGAPLRHRRRSTGCSRRSSPSPWRARTARKC